MPLRRASPIPRDLRDGSQARTLYDVLSKSAANEVSLFRGWPTPAGQRFRNGIDAPSGEGVAANYPAKREHRTAPEAVDLQCFYSVLAASGAELARPDQKRANYRLVATNDKHGPQDQEVLEKSPRARSQGVVAAGGFRHGLLLHYDF